VPLVEKAKVALVFVVGLDGVLVIWTVGARDALTFRLAALEATAVPATTVKDTIPIRAA
jgi:hypothetical protein